VRSECIVGGELDGNFPRQFFIQTAADINHRQFFEFMHRIGGEFITLFFDIGIFGIRLRTDRYIFTGRHRHRTCHQAGHAGNQNAIGRGPCSRHAEYQTGVEEYLKEHQLTDLPAELSAELAEIYTTWNTPKGHSMRGGTQGSKAGRLAGPAPRRQACSKARVPAQWRSLTSAGSTARKRWPSNRCKNMHRC